MKQQRNWGKEIKDVGTLLIVIGIVFLGLMLLAFSSSSDTIIYKLVDKAFFVLIFGGLFSMLFGVIIRSIGKSKEAKNASLKDKEQK